MIKKYNKLVRDRIPEIIASNGNECKTKTLTDTEYLVMLDAKLNEEIAEYQQDKNIEELADIWEVIRSIVTARGYTWEELETLRAKKEEERGGFSKKVFLIETVEK